MERKYYKAINFDLDTNQLKAFYPKYQQAYSDLFRFFKKKDFSHRQGSGYVSNKKLMSADVVDIIAEMCDTFSWCSTCIRKVDVTNVGAQYDLTPLLMPRSELEDEFSI